MKAETLDLVTLYLPEPRPCLFERLRIWPFHTVRSVGKAGVGFYRSDIMPAGTPKRRLSECILDKSSFWGCQILKSLEKTGARLG